MRRSTAHLAAVIVGLLLISLSVPAVAGEARVERAQKRLNSLGCSAGKADGALDVRVRTAVIRFQAANRMTQGGSLDAATRERLYAGKAKSCDDRAVPARSGRGRRIVLSQRQNYVWLVRKNGTVVAQQGMIDNPQYLGTGTYFTGPKCGRPGRIEHNTDYGGSLLLHHFVRFANCGVGFHRIPVYRSSGKQIHPDWYVGTNDKASHGCIRLTAGMARTVWDFTEARTKVVVLRG